MINDATVTGADNNADNGIVHIIDAVLVPSTVSVKETKIENLNVYPNPASGNVFVNSPDSKISLISIVNAQGVEVMNVAPSAFSATINVSDLTNGVYVMNITSNDKNANSVLVVSNK
jgi:hypothetical protein